MHTHPSQNLPALLWRLLGVCLTRRWFWVVVLLGLVGSAVFVMCQTPASLKVGTFNIQNYPKSERQPANALELIDSLELDALGVQEITRPHHFEKAVHVHLGPQWTVLFADQDVRHRVGLIFDDDVFELLETHTHGETAVTRGARATFEVRLRTETTLAKRTLRIFVVHLKAGGDGGEIRRDQLRRLRPILKDAVASGDEVVVLGDFNTTGESDRREVAALADAAQLDWTSEELLCTSYWSRPSDCPTTPLDHILATSPAHSVDAAGACETVGCEAEGACPVYVKRVSDHCPVTAEF
ncbi:endonuclease/exonuclease/phosphatase family protein [Persicimonas caeni]|nr:endonuclease/exonuclease/phosphatase family protein [Persicimonas caeni]